MNKFVYSVILIFAVALTAVACGSAQTKNNSNNFPEWAPQWLKDDGESATSSEEICAVGSAPFTMGNPIKGAVSEGTGKIIKKWINETKITTFYGSIPPGIQKDLIKSSKKIYVLVCIYRKDLEEANELIKKQVDKTDEDKVVQ